MRQNFGKKPWVMPMPILMIATYDENGNPDIMNAAWGCVGDDTQLFICVSPFHKTTKNILLNKAFTVSIATEDYVAACDYLGMESGNDVPNKVEKSGLHVHKSEFVNAPVIDELPLCFECTLISYEEEHCHLFGEIENTSADESILTDGKLDYTKLKPLVFDTCGKTYNRMGDVVAKAFSVGKTLK